VDCCLAHPLHTDLFASSSHIPNALTNRKFLSPRSHKQPTTNQSRPLRTPPLVLATIRALSNPARPLLQSPRQQPRIQHRRALQIRRSRPRWCRHQSFHDLSQLQRQRRHVSRPTSRQRWRGARLTCGHWRRPRGHDSQLSQFDDWKRSQRQRWLGRQQWWRVAAELRERWLPGWQPYGFTSWRYAKAREYGWSAAATYGRTSKSSGC
jgi:hypothetical protein